MKTSFGHPTSGRLVDRTAALISFRVLEHPYAIIDSSAGLTIYRFLSTKGQDRGHIMLMGPQQLVSNPSKPRKEATPLPWETSITLFRSRLKGFQYGLLLRQQA